MGLCCHRHQYSLVNDSGHRSIKSIQSSLTSLGRPIVTNFSWLRSDFLRCLSTFFHVRLAAQPQFSRPAVGLLLKNRGRSLAIVRGLDRRKHAAVHRHTQDTLHRRQMAGAINVVPHVSVAKSGSDPDPMTWPVSSSGG